MNRPEWVLGPGAVFVGGNVGGSVTVNVSTGGSDLLHQAIFDRSGLADSLDLARFTGREWLIERIDEYIARHPRGGYVVVQAEAGVGKSALAAKLVWTRPCAYHFTRLEGGRSPVEARRSLAAQLILAWELTDELAPGAVFPPGASRTDWLVKVLKEAARRRDATRPGDPLVLVVDGLDEASDPATDDQDTGIPLGLPHPESLPLGVFIVTTTRFTRPIGRLTDRDSWHTIKVDGPENLADMRRYLKAAVSGPAAIPALVERLAAHGIEPLPFAESLADRCQGVWIYLRYVLDAVCEGQRSPADVDTLPAGLAGYYVEQVQRWRGARDWATAGRPALSVLAALSRPATLADLADLTGAGKVPLREWLDERLRSFLDVTSDWQRRSRYSIRHQSLRDLFALTEEHDADPWPIRATREDLNDALLDAHALIAAAARRAARRNAGAGVLAPEARHAAIGSLFEAMDHARFAREGEETKERLADFTGIAELVVDDTTEDGEAATALLIAVLARYAEDGAESTLLQISQYVEEPSFYSGMQLLSYLINMGDDTRHGHRFAAILAKEFEARDDEDEVERTFTRLREALRTRLTETQSEQRDELCLKLGAHFQGIAGQAATAERYYRECIAIRARHAAARPGDVEAQLELGVAREKLAQLLAEDDEQLAEAWQLYDQAVEVKARMLGAGHAEVTASTAEMASLLNLAANRLSTAKRPDEARPLYERALRIRESQLGTDHLETAVILSNLAVLLHEQGRLDQARPLYEHVLRVRESQLSPWQPELADALNNLGVLLHDQGRLDQARPLYERALGLRENYARTRAERLDSLNGLASLLWDQGDFRGAAAHYQKVLGARQGTGPDSAEPDSPEAAAALSSFGVLLTEFGDLAQAKALAERGLAMGKAASAAGADSPAAVSALNDLARVLFEQGDLPGSWLLAWQALEICRQNPEPDRESAFCFYRLAWARHDEGRLGEAQELFEQAVEICERQFGPDHLQTQYRRYGLATVLHSQGQLDSARVLFERSLAACEEALPPGHPDLAYDLTGLAGVLRDQARLDEARAMLERALRIREQKLGPSHRTAQTLHALATVLRRQGDMAGAIAMFERALRIRSEKLGPGHPHTTLTRSELAELQGRHTS